jgi:hypothetical protein
MFMARTRQTFVNRKDGAIYVSVEPWPECFELEPDDKLTLEFDAADTGDTIQIDFINERKLVVWPNTASGDVEMLLNGESAEGKSWTFKHE